MSLATSQQAAAMLKSLPQCFEQNESFQQVLQALNQGNDVSLEGVWGSACALVAAAIRAEVTSPIVLIAPHLSEIDKLADALPLFTDTEVASFPAWESSPDERRLHDEIYAARLRILKQLVYDQCPALLVTSIESLIQPVPGQENIRANSRRLEIGQRLEPEELAKWLLTHKYHSTSAVELPGEFSLRGGILDVFAPDWNGPVRVELFGDEIESIREIDIETQRSVEALKQIDITALRHSRDYQGSFVDYLPADTVFLLIEPDQMKQTADDYLKRVDDVRDAFEFAETIARLNAFRKVSLAGISSGSFNVTANLNFESVEQFSGDIERVRGELDVVSQSLDVIIVCRMEAEVERLREILDATEVAKSGRLHYVLGVLHQGFRFREGRLVLISGDEIFHRGAIHRTKTRRLGKVIDSFLDLKKGDLVVHLGHGIGRYRGLRLIDKQGSAEEHLVLEFHGETKIFVPASKIDLVQKYVGGSKTRPPLARIGGVVWKKQKENVEKAVKDLAADLLHVQAERKSRPGIAFAEDTHWQYEFDASFPYQETDDQLLAISAIKQDMLQPRPMDRLLCGDVGFGKTEVAMRAAFKAVDNGYQVAVLVPTTILAEQHYKSFRERMAEFPFSIARLSRFGTAKEQREVIKGLKDGTVDVVIGTHRLASKDVVFQNLGVVVIDEEQRFGVEVKERLKQLRTTVDVLTMTATPIPRTLHMSLVGVRDISNLETAPKDRIAVETKVSRWSDELIRHAVLRELNRGGQVYFVHNRVQDIQVVAAKLQHIVPEAKIGIGHGQMAEGALEQVMVDFIEGKFDLLLATTIIESGLDIPNANTIFVDEADRYGLADLHQLRGRVGRSHHRGYCYMLLEPAKHLTPIASKRLHAIEEFSHMGAGFAISMRDLEIRGAGNILGTQQSGHIATVGYELYCQLLESAVRRLQKLPPKLSIDVDIDLPVEAYLPDDYVSDMRQKIDLYRRMTRIASDDDLNQIREELRDRFGSPPEVVDELLRLVTLKLDAAFWQVSSIYIEEEVDQTFLVFVYTNRSRIEQLAKLRGKKLRIVDDSKAYIPLPDSSMDGSKLLDFARLMLQPS
ncbi:transcription-repair coupling factor [Bremerella cremea]|uniref:Transcription-repair-coupling factor n=2 Tax=Bremerella cremea TaxID=1031537 RepID=A0A368KNX9_9BACT|nr:transcription-repair coupling factor [Bremerella cremea]